MDGRGGRRTVEFGRCGGRRSRDESPFYAESGGRSAIVGVLRAATGCRILSVQDTQKQAGVILHYRVVKSRQWKPATGRR